MPLSGHPITVDKTLSTQGASQNGGVLLATGEGVPAATAPQFKRTFSEFLWVACPKIAAGGTQLLANLLLVRSLGPERSGVVFVCITSIILGDAVLGSALDVAVLKLATSVGAGGPLKALLVQKAALVGKTVGCFALAIPVIAFAHPLSVMLFHQDSDPRLLLLSLSSLFGLLILRSVQTYFQVSGRFSLYGEADILHSIARYGGIGILLWLGLAKPLNILGVYALSPILVGIGLLLTAARSMLTTPFSWHVLRGLGSTAKWYLGTAAAASTNTRIDILILSALAGTMQAGFFSAAQVFVMPMQLIGMYLAIVFAPRILPLWEQGHLSPIYHKFQAWTVLGSLLIFVLALLFAGKGAAMLLPPSYRGSSTLMLWLLPSALTALINFPWTVSFLMFTHPRFLLVLEVSALPVLLLFYRMFVTSHGALGAAAVTSGFALVKTAIYQIVASRTIRRRSSRDQQPVFEPQGVSAGVS
jgi:O-antigen/teichoic acid export membrane protein